MELEPRLRICMGESGETGLRMPRRLTGPASQPMAATLDDTVAEDAQMLVFVATRRSAQSEARKLSERLKKRLIRQDSPHLQQLDELANQLKSLRLDSNVAGNLPLRLSADSRTLLSVTINEITSSGDVDMGMITWNNSDGPLTPSQLWRTVGIRTQIHTSSPNMMMINVISLTFLEAAYLVLQKKRWNLIATI